MPIPREIGHTWEFLHSEVCWLHGRWVMFRQLYGTRSERIELLNEVAPTFFGTLQRVLMDDIQLALNRLGDPSASGKGRNLTLETLTDELEALGINDLVLALRPPFANFRGATAGIVDRRNKIIAHTDLQKRQPGAEPIAGASRSEIETALKELRSFMNCVYTFFERSEMAYEHFIMNDDAMSVLHAAKEAVRYRELTKSGVIDPTDLVQSRYWKI